MFTFIEAETGQTDAGQTVGQTPDRCFTLYAASSV